MKIVFFYQYFGTPNGSWSTRVYELTRRWVLAGHDVTVITAPYDKSDIKANGFITKVNIEGIKVIIINSGDSNRFGIGKRVFRAIRFAFVSIWYTLRLDYDVCISSSGPITIGLPMIFAKKFRGKKTVFEVRDLWPAGGIEMGLIKTKWQKNAALWFEKICYKSADVVVTASVGQKNHISKRFENIKIEVIPNASDIELFSKKEFVEKLPDWTYGKKLFTHIGSLGLIHNTTFWLEVAKELKKMDLQNTINLVFIGDGKDKSFLESEKAKFGLDNLFFLGLMPKNELPLWVSNSVATLFATLDNEVQNASSPNKIFDSFAAGIPIVQTSNGWIKELVENENCGINVPLNDPKYTAERIIELSMNDDLVKTMGYNAFRLASTMFNRDLLAKSYIEIIDSIEGYRI
nr:glycosyltransferase family 4 protein [uncultured Sphingobacterium sp.]